MAGKPSIPASIHKKIQKLHNQGMGKKAIAAEIGCSMYTVRKALDPDFAGRERERQRALWPDRQVRRKDDENYIAYQQTYSQTPERREQVRQSMTKLRKQRASQA